MACTQNTGYYYNIKNMPIADTSCLFRKILRPFKSRKIVINFKRAIRKQMSGYFRKITRIHEILLTMWRHSV